uniref:EF-hand domain-containing protein n=1 Tax=Angiostrongylus cantonensis TaxID=6313 RepID=A0A158PB26_ANGCA
MPKSNESRFTTVFYKILQSMNADFSYIYQSEEILTTRMNQGFIADYGGGGFILPAALLADGNRWIDRASRVVIIDFTMFNANVNLFCIARLLLELPASGGVLPSYRFSTYDLMRYFGSFGKTLIVLEGIFLGFVSMRMNTSFLDAMTDAFFDDVLDTQENFNNPKEAIETFFRVFNYIGFNKTMNQFLAALSRSTKDIGGFAVMFAMFFSVRLPRVGNTGDLIYRLDDLRKWKQIVYISIKNLFLAIIIDSHVEVKARLARQQEGQGIFDWLRRVTRTTPADSNISDESSCFRAGYDEKDIDTAFDKLDIKHTGKIDDSVRYLSFSYARLPYQCSFPFCLRMSLR